jgi:hypothetical protein
MTGSAVDLGGRGLESKNLDMISLREDLKVRMPPQDDLTNCAFVTIVSIAGALNY